IDVGHSASTYQFADFISAIDNSLLGHGFPYRALCRGSSASVWGSCLVGRARGDGGLTLVFGSITSFCIATSFFWRLFCGLWLPRRLRWARGRLLWLLLCGLLLSRLFLCLLLCRLLLGRLLLRFLLSLLFRCLLLGWLLLLLRRLLLRLL